MKTASIEAVTVRGATEWRVEEYKTVGRFRGSATMRVAVKDDNGKPAALAVRSLRFTVTCSDGVRYVLTSWLDEFMSEHVRGIDHVSIRMLVHGMKLSVRRDECPPAVLSAYRKTSARVRAVLRLMRVEVAALPRFCGVRKVAA